MASRRKFSDEYKREAIRLATEPGVTKSQVASELGISVLQAVVGGDLNKPRRALGLAMGVEFRKMER